MRTGKRQMLCLIWMIMMTWGLYGCTQREELSASLDEVQKEQEAPEEKDKEEKVPEEEIYVYVCGQVTNPGVYRLPSEGRIYEALEAAGGLLETAAPEAVNQAEKLQDGVQVYVPSRQEVLEGGAAVVQGQDSQEARGGKVNLNTAGAEELMALPGIGGAKAQKIIEYREENGRFQSTEEIMQIPGIKNGIYEKIKERLTV